MSIIIDALKDGKYEQALGFIQHARDHEVNARDIQGQTALHIAIQKNLLEISSALLKNGANIHAVASDLCYRHMTPLHYAALTGNLRGTRLLLAWGAKTLIHNERHQTPAALARQHGFVEVARTIERYQPSASLAPKNNVINFAAYQRKKRLRAKICR